MLNKPSVKVKTIDLYEAISLALAGPRVFEHVWFTPLVSPCRMLDRPIAPFRPRAGIASTCACSSPSARPERPPRFRRGQQQLRRLSPCPAAAAEGLCPHQVASRRPTGARSLVLRHVCPPKSLRAAPRGAQRAALHPACVPRAAASRGGPRQHPRAAVSRGGPRRRGALPRGPARD
jgi:hypothetical protein